MQFRILEWIWHPLSWMASTHLGTRFFLGHAKLLSKRSDNSLEPCTVDLLEFVLADSLTLDEFEKQEQDDELRRAKEFHNHIQALPNELDVQSECESRSTTTVPFEEGDHDYSPRPLALERQLPVAPSPCNSPPLSADEDDSIYVDSGIIYQTPVPLDLCEFETYVDDVGLN